jgi:glycosyltransferase involved in cell wall biosynthesis
LNSIATRTPSLKSGSDVRKIGSKLRRFAQNAVRGAEEVAQNLFVFTPLVLPLPYNRAAQIANRHIVKQTIALLRRQLDMSEFQLWTFLPTALPYVGTLGESLDVYYITDEFSQFSELDGGKVRAMERELCERADVVFCTANSLLEAKRPYNPETYLASHGVDHAHFSSALRPDLGEAPELAALPRPILGFFGLIHDWIDLSLLGYLAKARPQWSLVLIGGAKVDLGSLQGLPNVHLLGRKPYEELPRYCKSFSVGLIPFVINELTRHVNPIKLREYLSAGLPVVSTPLPECGYYRDHCHIASSPPEFLAAVERAVAEDSPDGRRQRSEAMESETWDHVVEKLGARVRQARERRGWQAP